MEEAEAASSPSGGFDSNDVSQLRHIYNCYPCADPLESGLELEGCVEAPPACATVLDEDNCTALSNRNEGDGRCRYDGGGRFATGATGCGQCRELVPNWHLDLPGGAKSASYGCASLNKLSFEDSSSGKQALFDCDFTLFTGGGLTPKEVCCECGGGGARPPPTTCEDAGPDMCGLIEGCVTSSSLAPRRVAIARVNGLLSRNRTNEWIISCSKALIISG